TDRLGHFYFYGLFYLYVLIRSVRKAEIDIVPRIPVQEHDSVHVVLFPLFRHGFLLLCPGHLLCLPLLATGLFHLFPCLCSGFYHSLSFFLHLLALDRHFFGPVLHFFLVVFTILPLYVILPFLQIFFPVLLIGVIIEWRNWGHGHGRHGVYIEHFRH